MTSPFIVKEHKYTKRTDFGHYSLLYLEIGFGLTHAWEAIPS